MVCQSLNGAPSGGTFQSCWDHGNWSHSPEFTSKPHVRSYFFTCEWTASPELHFLLRMGRRQDGQQVDGLETPEGAVEGAGVFGVERRLGGLRPHAS